tara:strand:+ start:5219 stop:5467 length:249 start_codon:yes stop_codon:yes gene_type:complete
MSAAQAEVRYGVSERLTVSAFGGVGRIARDFGRLGKAANHGAWGTGMRYKLAKEKPITLGFDIARGDNEWQFYFQIGDWLTF